MGVDCGTVVALRTSRMAMTSDLRTRVPNLMTMPSTSTTDTSRELSTSALPPLMKAFTALKSGNRLQVISDLSHILA